jgi:hypothetical protein
MEASAFAWRIGAILVGAVLGTAPAFAQTNMGAGAGGETTGSTTTTTTVGSTTPSFQPQTGYWENPAEPGGRSVVLEANASGEIFAAVFTYNESGQPTWFVVDTGANAAGQQNGGLQRFVAGQDGLSGPYAVNYFDGFNGNVTFTFDSPTTGTMTWPTGSMRIARTNFVPSGALSGPQAGAPRGGWWWNAAESGRGYFIEVQNNTLTFAAALYDSLDQPVWYLSQGTMIAPTVYSGEFLITYGGMTMDGPYHRATDFWTRGNFTVQFTSDDTAVITMPDGHQVNLTRYTF